MKTSMNAGKIFWITATALLLFPYEAFTQYTDHRNRKVDSLEQVLKTNPPEGSELAAIYEELMWGYMNTNREKSMEYARKNITIREPLDKWAGVFSSYKILAQHYYATSQYDSSMYYLEKATVAIERMKSFPKKYTEKNIDDGYSSLYGTIGNHYSLQGKLHTAISYYQKAITLFEKYGWNESLSIAYGNIGQLYLDMDNNEQAETNSKKALEYAVKAGDSLMIAMHYRDLGTVYLNQKDYGKALEAADEAYRYFSAHAGEEAGDCVTVLTIYSRIYLMGYKDDLKAESYIRQALAGADTLDYPHDKADALSALAAIYLHRREWRKAEQTAQLSLATDSTDLQYNIYVYRQLAKAYNHLGEAAKADEYHERADALQTEYSNKNYQSSLTEMEVRYETEKKEMQIARQEAVIARQDTLRTALFGGMALLAVILLLLWHMLRLRNRRNRELNERNRILDEMNATKDKFFSIISHDLRNPAIAQRNALQTLINHAGTWDADALKEFYSGLLHSANSEVELLNNLLNWARVQTGRMPCMPDAFDPASVLQHELNLIRSMAESKGVAFNTSIPGDIVLTADSNMFCTILRNLLTNAVKFTPAGGTVSLSLQATEDGKHTVTVSDTGQGMTDEQLNNLFRIDIRTAAGTAGEQGTGLGLIVCKEMLEKHNSTLHIESEEGKGSKFRFTL
ncbi:hypothetical protein FACS1894181_06280 [Bacteroidia bacterium]|nr:hypothetical protein FACS1894181_06280 [Bacteroidia bacterium]